MKLKTIEEILKEFKYGLKLGSFIYLDTGGIMDIIESCKKEHNNPINFFKRIINDENINFLLTMKTCEECDKHTSTKKNSHVYIMPKKVFNYVRNFEKDIFNEKNFISREDKEEIREDVYWTSKLACKHDKKKHEEGFGEVDKNILYNAAFASTGKIKYNNYLQDMGFVGILSPDKHITDGVKFMNTLQNNLGIKKYSLYSINTRK